MQKNVLIIHGVKGVSAAKKKNYKEICGSEENYSISGV